MRSYFTIFNYENISLDFTNKYLKSQLVKRIFTSAIKSSGDKVNPKIVGDNGRKPFKITDIFQQNIYLNTMIKLQDYL